MYDETYGVIYEVIMRKFRASMEPFWDLKIGKYVEYLTPVSSEYIKLTTVQFCHWVEVAWQVQISQIKDTKEWEIVYYMIRLWATAYIQWF